MERILFLCIGNSCRSQMAEGYARRMVPPGWVVASAGSKPTGQVDGTAIELMKEEGIDLTRHRSKGLEDLPQITWDLVVGMGCGDECPHLPARIRVDWDLPDPRGMPREKFRRVRDEIRRRLSLLLRDTSAGSPDPSPTR